MNKLVYFICLLLSVSGYTFANNDILVFDPATTKTFSVINGASIVSKDNESIVISTPSDATLTGFVVNGLWDFTDHYELVVEFVNLNNINVTPTIRVENVGANFKERKLVLRNWQGVAKNSTSSIVIPLPPTLPYPEIADKLSGMRFDPYHLIGLETSLRPQNVAKVYVYFETPDVSLKWALKKIYVRRGTMQDMPVWMSYSPNVFFPFIDEYGQFKHKDWPGKTKTDADFTAALAEEETDLNNHTGPEKWSQYGGWLDGPKMQATGHFYVEKVQGKWWLVDPEGHLFWSHGVLRISPFSAETPLDDRKMYFKDLPEKGSPFEAFYHTHDMLFREFYEEYGIDSTYDHSSANLFRKYGTNWKELFAKKIHRRLKSWGMNTIANGSDSTVYMMRKTPYCERVVLRKSTAPWILGNNVAFKDPFHSMFRKTLETELLAHSKEFEDPWCIGFFVDNELRWGYDTSIADGLLVSAATQPSKREFINHLKNKYLSIENLNDSWKTTYANWDDMLISKILPESRNISDCSEFSEIVIIKYFQTVRDELKRLAPNKLYLGSRFIPAYTPDRVRKIAALYCDVLSINLYANDLSSFSLPAGVDAPVIISEYHFGALDRGPLWYGLKNAGSQEGRGLSYETFVNSALQHSNIVGTHWHQFSDQATTGRFDGENAQVGLTDVCDKPYYELINYIRKVGYSMYKNRMPTYIDEDVFKEDFSNFTGGSLSSPLTTRITNLDAYTLLPGWTGNRIYCANGAIKLGADSDMGWITTPLLNLSKNNGKFWLSLRSMNQPGDTTALQVYVNEVLKMEIRDLPNSSAYTLASFGPFEFDCGTSSTSISIKAMGKPKANRFYLDDFRISLIDVASSIPKPTVDATIYSKDGELYVLAPIDEQINVYNILGQFISKKKSEGTMCQFKLKKNELYLVQVRNIVSKVLIN